MGSHFAREAERTSIGLEYLVRPLCSIGVGKATCFPSELTELKPARSNNRWSLWNSNTSSPTMESFIGALLRTPLAHSGNRSLISPSNNQSSISTPRLQNHLQEAKAGKSIHLQQEFPLFFSFRGSLPKRVLLSPRLPQECQTQAHERSDSQRNQAVCSTSEGTGARRSGAGYSGI